MKPLQVARMIDHTILKANITNDQIRNLCNEAITHKFASVCVPPYYLPLVDKLLKNNTDVLSCTVISFPLGYDDINTKVAGIKRAIENGADELDVVINIAAIKNGDWKYIEEELRNLRFETSRHNKILKIIFETCYLSDEEISKLASLCTKAEVDFVKTSTGFGTAGAELHHIEIMKSAIGNNVKIKASGGIRTWEDAKKMIEKGVHRIGASSGVNILAECNRDLS